MARGREEEMALRICGRDQEKQRMKRACAVTSGDRDAALAPPLPGRWVPGPRRAAAVGPITPELRSTCDRDVASNAALLVGFDMALIAESGIADDASSKESLAAKYAAVMRSKADAQAALKKTQSEYTRFSKLRNEAISLAQQLREIAARLIENNEKEDECPLCHTSFPRGGLAKHMRRGVDTHVEQTGQALLRRQRSEEAALSKIVAIEAAYEWLVEFCDRASIAKNVPVVGVLGKRQGYPI